ncbi:molecular chaperone [Variovorax sp. YR216]|uniref:fimbrial biogenesis chaperone n=1 Tax=Variovorax sp. YR216 TaxID=1882828 RepID=UPI00115FA86F|nr:molecular chaperone [Variovorax sp. YR216]
MLRAAGVACLLAATGAASAGVEAPTRVVFEGTSKDMSLVLRNPGQTPSLVQVWIDEGDPRVDPSKVNSPFLIPQPLARVDPGERHRMRLLYAPDAKPLPEDRESRFFLNILDIPPKVDPVPGGAAMLTLAVRYRMPLIYRPAGLTKVSRPAYVTASFMPWGLEQENGQWQLQAKNEGRYYLTLGDFELKQDGATFVAKGDEVAPYSQKNFALTASDATRDMSALDKSRPMELTYTVADDGGQRVTVRREMVPDASHLRTLPPGSPADSESKAVAP